MFKLVPFSRVLEKNQKSLQSQQINKTILLS